MNGHDDSHGHLPGTSQVAGLNAASALSVAGLPIVLVLAGLCCFGGLGTGRTLNNHEAIVGQCARQIRQTGEWLIPYFNTEPFIRKTPLQFWLAAAASYVVDPPNLPLPVSETASRLPSALAAFLCVLVVYWLARSMYSERAALVSAAIMAVCGGTIAFAHNAQAEMLVTLFTTLAMALFYKSRAHPESRRKFMIWYYVALAAGMLAKAPLPLAVVGLPLFVYWFLTLPAVEAVEGVAGGWKARFRSFGSGVVRQFKKLPELWLIPGTLLFVALSAPWPIYVYRHIENALPLWRTEFIDRIGGDIGDNVEWFGYYLPWLFAITAPFCLSLFAAVASPFREVFHRECSGLLFVFTWVAVDLFFFSYSPFKRPHYIVPIIPALCLLLGPEIDRLFFGAIRADSPLVRRAALAICGVVVVAAPIGVIVLRKYGPEMIWLSATTATLTVAGVVLSAWLFCSNRRALSFLSLLLFPYIVFSWAWSALGRARYDEGVIELARQMNALSIGPNDKITWAIGRPDARLSYYGGFQVDLLYDAAELASRRRGRSEIPLALKLEGARKVTQRLNGPQEEYFIFEAEELEQFQEFLRDPIHFREVLRVQTRVDDPDEALVLVTNGWNQGEEEDWTADSGSPPPFFTGTTTLPAGSVRRP